MKLNRWYALPAAVLAAVIIGVIAVEAAPSPSASPTTSKNYAQVFVDKLAAILPLTPTATKHALDDPETEQKVSDSAVDAAVERAAKGDLDKAVQAGTIAQGHEDAILSRVGAGLNFRFGQKGCPGSAPGAAPSGSPAATPGA